MYSLRTIQIPIECMVFADKFVRNLGGSIHRFEFDDESGLNNVTVKVRELEDCDKLIGFIDGIYYHKHREFFSTKDNVKIKITDELDKDSNNIEVVRKIRVNNKILNKVTKYIEDAGSSEILTDYGIDYDEDGQEFVTLEVKFEDFSYYYNLFPFVSMADNFNQLATVSNETAH